MNKAVDKLESVKAAFRDWRETRTCQGRIPDYLWEQEAKYKGTKLTRCSTFHGTIRARARIVP